MVLGWPVVGGVNAVVLLIAGMKHEEQGFVQSSYAVVGGVSSTNYSRDEARGAGPPPCLLVLAAAPWCKFNINRRADQPLAWMCDTMCPQQPARSSSDRSDHITLVLAGYRLNRRGGGRDLADRLSLCFG